MPLIVQVKSIKPGKICKYHRQVVMQITGRLATAVLKLTKRMGEKDPWNIFDIDEGACEESAIASPLLHNPMGRDLPVTEVGSPRGRKAVIEV